MLCSSHGCTACADSVSGMQCCINHVHVDVVQASVVFLVQSVHMCRPAHEQELLRVIALAQMSSKNKNVTPADKLLSIARSGVDAALQQGKKTGVIGALSRWFTSDNTKREVDQAAATLRRAPQQLEGLLSQNTRCLALAIIAQRRFAELKDSVEQQSIDLHCKGARRVATDALAHVVLLKAPDATADLFTSVANNRIIGFLQSNRSLCAALQERQENAAMAELEGKFAEQRGLLKQALHSASDQLEARLEQHNALLPDSAPQATVRACRIVKERAYLSPNYEYAQLTVDVEHDWQSFGYSVSHLASRSTGGEAGASVYLE